MSVKFGLSVGYWGPKDVPQRIPAAGMSLGIPKRPLLIPMPVMSCHVVSLSSLLRFEPLAQRLLVRCRRNAVMDVKTGILLIGCSADVRAWLKAWFR